MKLLVWLMVLLVCILLPGRVAAQGAQQIVIEQSDEFSYSGLAGVRALKGNVRLRHNRTVLYCDSALMFDGGRQARAYGRVRIVEPGENLLVRCRYLEYDAETGSARLYQDVVLSDDVLRLYSPELTYNTSKRVVNYTQGARMEDGSARLSSRLGRYAVESGEMIFNREVKLEDDSLTLSTDSLRYNRKWGRLYFVAPTHFVIQGTDVETSGGWHEMRTRISHLYPFCRVQHYDHHFLWSDSLYFDQNRGLGTANGRVQWIDTLWKIEIRANHVQFDRTRAFYKAWGDPLLRSFGGGEGDSLQGRRSTQSSSWVPDTLSLTADTLMAMRVSSRTNIADKFSENSKAGIDTSWLFKSWGRVAGQSRDAQLSCDSLVYLQSDSLALLMGTPLLWPATFQVSGPTMKFYNRGENSGTLLLPEGGVLADRLEDSLFHQITAARMQVSFDSGSIQYLHAVGQVLTLYHIPGEDSGYVGLNRIASDSVNIYFARQRPNRMIFLGKPEGVLWPLAQVPAGEDTVAGFEWMGKLKISVQEQIKGVILKNPDRGGYELFSVPNQVDAVDLNGGRNLKRKSRRR